MVLLRVSGCYQLTHYKRTRSQEARNSWSYTCIGLTGLRNAPLPGSYNWGRQIGPSESEANTSLQAHTHTHQLGKAGYRRLGALCAIVTS